MSLLEDLKSRLFKRESKGLFNSNNKTTVLDNNNIFSRYSRFEKINPNVSYKESLNILDDDQVKVAYLIFTHILCSFILLVFLNLLWHKATMTIAWLWPIALSIPRLCLVMHRICALGLWRAYDCQWRHDHRLNL